MGGQYNPVETGSDALRITTATTTVVTTGKTFVQAIIVGATAAGTITVQDAAGVVKAVLKVSIAEGTYQLRFNVRGLTIITGAASDITVVFSRLA